MAEISSTSRKVPLDRGIRQTRWLWLGALLFFAFTSALAETKNSPSAKPNVGSTTKEGSACPSREFAAFFQAFSKRADLQRRYTRLPFEHGLLDVALIGTNEEEAFETRTIHSFEGIPQYNKATGGIFPTPAEMRAGKLKTRITTSESPKHKGAWPEEIITSPDYATATLFLPDTGFQVYYRFRREAGCWFLIGISDRST